MEKPNNNHPATNALFVFCAVCAAVGSVAALMVIFGNNLGLITTGEAALTGATAIFCLLVGVIGMLITESKTHTEQP